MSVNGTAGGPPLAAAVPGRRHRGAASPGANQIEIKVTNLWANRMIGDQLLPEDKRYTFSMFKPYKKDSPLLESGLLGPVTLSSVVRR